MQINWVIMSVIVLTSQVALSQIRSDMKFFNEEINYWKTKPEVQKQQSAKEERKFDWQTYLDPKKEEFFREGDHLPPEPFMEIVRNPSDDNLKNWFRYMEKKNELSQRLAQRMEEYTAKNSAVLSSKQKDEIAQKVSSLDSTSKDYKRFRFRMYFDSTCPHCKNMFETLGELQELGFYVEARQVDSGDVKNFASTVPIVKASKEEVKGQNIASVPLLLIGDLQSKKVIRVNGYQTTSEVLSTLKTNSL